MHRDASLIRAENSARDPLLVVGDSAAATDDVAAALEGDFNLLACASRNDALKFVRELESPPPVALIDLGPPPPASRADAGLQLIPDLLKQAPDMTILALAAPGDAARARSARMLGAADFAARNTDAGSLLRMLRDATRFHEAERATMAPAGQAGANGDRLFAGIAPAVEKLRRQVAQYAGALFPVLVEGEPGSAPARVAAALHAASRRGNELLRAVHCARTDVARAIESAADGSLLLDEIGELPATAQSQLLQAIERGEAAGGAGRARIIASTSRDLRQDVRKGAFRRDLYCRLSAFVINVPPVRDLDGDSLLLLDHFRELYAAAAQVAPFRLRPEAAALWREYAFPGDLRELRHVVMRLTTRYPGNEITADELAAEFIADPQPHASSAAPAEAERLMEQAQRHLQRESAFDLDRMLRAWEESYVSAAMKLTHGNVSRAAKMLGLNRTTLYSRLESLRKTG